MRAGNLWRACLTVAAASALLGAAAREASANANFFQLWQTRGGDASRDGNVGGGNLIRHPEVVVRLNLNPHQERAAAALGDLDGDGVREEVGLDGGAAVALRADLSTIWEGDDLGLTRIEALADLDGDGADEVLASDGQMLYILQGADGEVAYSFGLGDNERLWLRDLDGDGADEVLVRGPGAALRAYGFAGGADQGRLLWQLMDNVPAEPFEVAVGDGDGDGARWEILTSDRAGGRALVWDASDGAPLHQHPERVTFGDGGCGPAWLANVDEDPAQEFFYTSARREGGNGNVFAAAYDYGERRLLWSREFGAGAIGSTGLDAPEGAVRDLDGDGDAELILSIFNNTREITPEGAAADMDGIDAPGAWTTAAYDANSGALVAALPGRRVVGVIQPDGARPVVLVKLGGGALEEMNPAAQVLEGLRLEGGQWRTLWRLPAATALPLRRRQRPGCPSEAAARPSPLVADLDGDGAQELYVLRYLDDDARPELLQQVALANDEPQVTASLLLDSYKDIEAEGAVAGLTGPDSAHVALRFGDGYLTALDAALAPAARFALGSGVAELRGLRSQVGNNTEYFLRSEVPGQRAQVLDPGAVEDGQAAELWVFPEGAWAPDVVFVDPDSDLNLLPVVTREGSEYLLRAYDNMGELAWSEEIEGAQGLPTHMTYAHVGGLEHEDLVFLYEGASGPRLEARDGTDGSLLVRVSLSSIPGASLESRLLRLPGAQAEDFRDENEPDDLLMIHTQGATLLEGTSLGPIRSISTGPSAFLSSLADIDGDGELDVLVQSPDGTRSARRLSNDEELWSISPQPSHQGSPETLAGLLLQGNDRTEGAHVAIGGAFGDLTLYDKATGQPRWSVCLAGGEVTVIPPGVTLDEAACAGAPLADITSARVDIGQQDTLLVGAGDGWGYALRGDGSPVWALPFHRPLGPLIIADGNGDRSAEVVVAADNGAAYVLKGRFDPPAAIRDVALGDDGAPAMVEADINEQRHARGLAFAWEAVPGADRYSVAVVGDDDILRPLTELGNVTSVAYAPEDAQLKPGATYYAVVQARSTAGQRSPMITSDGVTIVDDVAPTAAIQLLSASPLSPALDQVVALQVTATDNMGLREVSLEATAEGADAPAWSRRWPGARAMTLSRQEIWSARDEADAPLPDGVYTVTVEVEDYGDLRAEASLQVTLDSTPPPTPTWSAPSPDAALMDPLPTLTGATEPGAAVQVWLNDAPLCDAVADDAGAFSCAPAEPLPDGAYAATAQARDALGNQSPVSDALRFSIDATAPATPTIVEPTDAEVLTPGVVTFIVRAEAGVAVTVSLGEEVTCATAEPLDSADMYTCTSAQALEPGTYIATATATDEIGWTSPASAAVTFTVMAEDANNGQNNGEPNNGNPNNGEPNNGNPNNGEPNNGQNNGNPNNGQNNGEPVNNGQNNGANNGQNNGVNPNNDANNGGGPMVGVGAPADDGCGCAVPTQRAPRGAALLGALLALGAASLRRRR